MTIYLYFKLFSINLFFFIYFFLQANILHVKHGWDVSILYSHKHARGTQSRGMAPLALVLNLLARRKTMYLRQGERLGIYLQNLLIVSFFVTLHVTSGVDLIPLVGRNKETTKGFSVEASG